MTTYEFLIAVHILSAALWVGSAFALQVIGRMALASGDRQRMHRFILDSDWLGPRIIAPITLVVLLFGFLLIRETPYGFDDTFVSIGLAGWLISFAIGVGYFPKAGKDHARIVESEGLESQAFIDKYRQVALFSLLDLLIVIGVLLVMAVKP